MKSEVLRKRSEKDRHREGRTASNGACQIKSCNWTVISCFFCSSAHVFESTTFIQRSSVCPVSCWKSFLMNCNHIVFFQDTDDCILLLRWILFWFLMWRVWTMQNDHMATEEFPISCIITLVALGHTYRYTALTAKWVTNWVLGVLLNYNIALTST